jgi:carboxylesterase type B
MVSLESGSLAKEWHADHTARAFKGVPYARPPIKESAFHWEKPALPPAASGSWGTAVIHHCASAS